MEINLSWLVDSLAGILGVTAVALGGSRARGSHHPCSDYDIALYYEPDNPLDTQALDELASSLDDRRTRGLVTPVGGWGPWINGGGWLQLGGQAVDIIYRDLGLTRQVVAACLEGNFSMVYQPGHPLGYPSYIYLGESALAVPLWDPHGCLAALTAKTEPTLPASSGPSWSAPSGSAISL